MALKLYGSPEYPAMRRVLAALYEKEVDYEIIKVDVAGGEHQQDEYKKLQPFGVIPTLVDGSLTIFETRAICRYLQKKYENQGTPLYGSTLADQALVETWLEVESHNYNPAIMNIEIELVIKLWKGGKTDEVALAEYIEKFNKILDIYEEQLTKHKYLAGDFFSLADLSHLPFTHFLVAVAKRGDLIFAKPHVKAWWEDISSRPAWKKALAVAGPNCPLG